VACFGDYCLTLVRKSRHIERIYRRLALVSELNNGLTTVSRTCYE